MYADTIKSLLQPKNKRINHPQTEEKLCEPWGCHHDAEVGQCRIAFAFWHEEFNVSGSNNNTT